MSHLGQTMRVLLTGFFAALTLATWDKALSQDAHKSEYAGLEKRQIKSLSDDDVNELRRGGGWGLAKAAELNGVPGPAHLLELSDQIPLSPSQVSAIEKLYKTMRVAAVEEGEKLIRLEAELNTEFAEGTISEKRLRNLIDEISDSRARLRYIHLSTHLSTPNLLTKDQIARYNHLRGYSSDPCEKVPAGHDPAMWRKHNDCDE